MKSPQILIVEDEQLVAEDLKETLQRLGYSIAGIAQTGEAAVENAGALQPDLILMDISLAGRMDGIAAAGTIATRYDIPVIFLTAFADKEMLQRAKITEPYAYLLKPYEERELQSSIEISLYKHATDRELRENRETVLALLNATKNGLFLVSPEGIILAINETMAERAGKPVNELVNQPLQALFSLHAVSALMVENIERSQNGTLRSFDEEFNGRWFENNIRPISGSQGSVRQVAVYSHDVSDRKAAEIELQHLNENLKNEKEALLVFRSALDEMSDLVVMTDLVGNILYVNHAFERRFGYSASEIQGRHLNELQDPSNKFSLERAAFLDSQKRVWTGNAVWLSKYGLKVQTSLKSTPVISDNRPLQRVFVLREST